MVQVYATHQVRDRTCFCSYAISCEDLRGRLLAVSPHHGRRLFRYRVTTCLSPFWSPVFVFPGLPQYFGLVSDLDYLVWPIAALWVLDGDLPRGRHQVGGSDQHVSRQCHQVDVGLHQGFWVAVVLP